MQEIENPKERASNLETKVDELCASTEKAIRKEPLKCGAIAFLAGLVLTVLPIGELIGLIFRVVFSLFRPVLIVLGALKLYEEIEKKRTQHSSNIDHSR